MAGQATHIAMATNAGTRHHQLNFLRVRFISTFCYYLPNTIGKISAHHFLLQIKQELSNAGSL